MIYTSRKRPRANGSSPSTPVTPELVRIIPSLLWFILAILIASVSYKPVLDQISRDGISKMSFATFQVEFARSEFNKAASAARAKGYTAEGTPAFDSDRIQRLVNLLPGTRALWVTDENPTADFPERRALSSIGISFDLARSTNEAQELFDLADLWHSPYDFIISDINRSKDVDPIVAPCFPDWRDGPTEAGCKLLQAVRGRYPQRTPPFIFYSHDAPMGTPPGAFGSTDRFQELAQLVLDAVERRQPRGYRNAPDSPK